MLNTVALVSMSNLEAQLRERTATPGVELATQLVHAARWALENAPTLEAVKDVQDHLKAAQIYFQQKHATMVATNLLAAELVRCQWRLGNELLRIPRKEGWRGDSSAARTNGSFGAALAEMDIRKSKAYQWQMLAQVDAQDLEQYLNETLEKDEITTTGVLSYFTSRVTVEPRDDAEDYADGDPGEPPEENPEPPTPRTVVIVCRHCGTKDSYEV